MTCPNCGGRCADAYLGEKRILDIVKLFYDSVPFYLKIILIGPYTECHLGILKKTSYWHKACRKGGRV